MPLHLPSLQAWNRVWGKQAEVVRVGGHKASSVLKGHCLLECTVC